MPTAVCADEKATGTNWVLRLAGYRHLKRRPFLVKLTYASDDHAWMLEEALEVWPDLVAATQEPEPPKPVTIDTSGERLGRYVAQALQGEYVLGARGVANESRAGWP